MHVDLDDFNFFIFFTIPLSLSFDSPFSCFTCLEPTGSRYQH